MDRYSFLIHQPYNLLILGVFLLFLSAIWVFTGKVLARFDGWVYRTEDPTEFWGVVALYVVVGGFFIAEFLSKVN